MDIQRVIKKYGLSQADVAKEMINRKGTKGISLQTLRTTLSNGNPTLSTLENIANAIGCDVSEFFETNTQANTIRCPKCGTELTLKENVPTD